MTTVEKLNKFPGPITKLFPSPEWKAEYELSPDQVKYYHQNGYVKGGRILNDAQLEALREGLDRMFTGKSPRMADLYEIDEDWRNDPKKNIYHILGAWLVEEAFHDILWHPTVTVKVGQLLDTRKVRFWHDQVFFKPPRHPGIVTWHQDYSYWIRAYPARHTTCNIVLDDVNLENGCLHYVPKSHTWGLLPKLGLAKDMDAVKDHLNPEQLEAFKPEPMILKAGECTFHDSHTMHGSYGNNSDHPRRAVVINFMHPETRCDDGNNPLMYGVPVVPKGEIIQGDYFPILLG